MNTHYGVICFSGDPAGEHPDFALRGKGPSLDLIACGPEDFCWRSIAEWTATHELRLWESVEVVARDRVAVRDGILQSQVYREARG